MTRCPVIILRRSGQSRGGGTAVVTALMLTPLLLMVAFAVDLCNVWRTDAELQNAADAAALAGASQLVAPGQALLPAVGALVPDVLKQAAAANAVLTAQTYAAR